VRKTSPFRGRAAGLLALLLCASAAAQAIVDPAAQRKEAARRIGEIRRQVGDIDAKLQSPGLKQPDFAVLQDLRTNLEQERKVLEERERVMERLEKSGLVMYSTAAAAGAQLVPSTSPARSLWEPGGWARFEGMLPCAGCDGINTELTLYNDGLRYAMTERYVGASAPKRVFKSEGLWTTLRGHGDDPDATVFELDYDKPGKERHFLRLSEDEIKLVDLDESKLRKKPNLILRRAAP
jgi:copper homeostasis protein (lipoprotein)